MCEELERRWSKEELGIKNREKKKARVFIKLRLFKLPILQIGNIRGRIIAFLKPAFSITSRVPDLPLVLFVVTMLFGKE